MEISKSTPYVRYRENISSTLHKGTIHIESEYLDRERKTTIESIEGQTWQNMVNGENKEEHILPRLGLKIEGNEDVLDSKEQYMPIDTIIGDVEPVANEDGTYTYEISTMEGSYAKTLDGENNFSLTSDGLVGDMYIKYNAQGEEVNGNIVMNNQSGHTIEDSNTGEIKSAILSGNTLVNLVVNSSVEKTVGKSSSTEAKYDYIYQLENNKEYTLQFEISNFNATQPMSCSFDDGLSAMDNITIDKNGAYKIKFTTKNRDSTQIWFYWQIASWEDGYSATVKNIAILEGDYANFDIPYFEGMQSVKMPVLTTTGKNLFDSSTEIVTGQGINSINGLPYNASAHSYTGFLRVKPNTTYTITQSHNKTWVFAYNKNKEYIGMVKTDIPSGGNFTTPNDTYYIRLDFNTVNTSEIVNGVQIEQGTVATPYEPYQSNILTTPSDVTLRAIGDVKDELDLMTGKLTQRIDEVVLDGSDDISFNVPFNGVYEYALNGLTSNMIISIPKTRVGNYNNPDYNGYYYTVENGIRIINHDCANTSDFKQWLSQNPITIQYQLTSPTVKTVDLTIKDQDNRTIKSLSTHPSTTHINLSSDGLIPDAEISYTMYGNIGETTGEKITDGVDSKLIEGKVYGDTLLNVLPSPSLKNSMDYNTSMQKLNDGYDNVIITDVEFKEVTLYGQTMVNIEGIKSVENPTIIITNSPMRFGKGGRK